MCVNPFSSALPNYSDPIGTLRCQKAQEKPEELVGRMSGELDLRLRLGSCCAGAGNDERRVSGQREHQQEEQITIFYNGRICVRNVTEIQARAIIAMAEQEMDDQMANKKKKQKQKQQQQQEKKQSDQVSSPPPLPMEQQLLSNHQQNSMKRSLQQFLQKRKSRSDAVAAHDAHRPRLLEIN